MTDIQTWLDQVSSRANTAGDHVAKLCTKEDRWTMTVPAVDTDSDVLLIQVTDHDVPKLVAALQAVLDLHQPGTRVHAWNGDSKWQPKCPACEGAPGVHGCGCWQDEQIEHTCSGCVADHGQHQPWPCPTVRAVQAAIGDKR